MGARHQTYEDFGPHAPARPRLIGRVIEGGVAIRPLAACDRDGLLSLFERLSPESRRRRFLGPKAELSERELGRLTDVDHVRREALVAVHPRDQAIVGVARYAQFDVRPGVADVAIAVADDYQGIGIGSTLAGRLIVRARANRLEAHVASTLRDNRRALRLMRRLGFRPAGGWADQIELELLLD